MKQHLLPHELEESWLFSSEECTLLSGRSTSHRLGFAILLKFFQIMGHFPKERTDVPRQAVEYLAALLNISASTFDDYSFSDRLLKFHRADIRAFLSFRPATNKDASAALQWLEQEALLERSTPHLHECLRVTPLSRNPLEHFLSYSCLPKMHVMWVIWGSQSCKKRDTLMEISRIA